jgi:transcriptional regulator with XRE-family HTH domain
MQNDLGKAIKARRKELKLTAEELAKRVGVDRTFISKIEARGMLPSREVLARMERALNTTSLLELYIEKKAPFLEDQCFHSLYSMPVSLRKSLKSQESAELARFLNRAVESDMPINSLKQELLDLLQRITPNRAGDQQLCDQVLATCAKLRSEKQAYWASFKRSVQKVESLIKAR